jgi:hypothetical protein
MQLFVRLLPQLRSGHHQYHLIMSHARRDVIEDSEPERERVRLESRRRRKQERSEVAKGITDWPQQEEPIIISSNCTTPVDEAPGERVVVCISFSILMRHSYPSRRG